MRRVEHTEFFRAVVASLVLRGIKSISTRGDQHQEQFQQYVAVLAKSNMTDRLPLLLPSPFTGRYAEWDRALIQLQLGEATRAVGPFFTEVELLFSKSRAERVIAQLPSSIAQVLHTAAASFST